MKVIGKIKAISRKSNRYAFLVDGEWLSVFLNEKTPDDLRAVVEGLTKGQEVEFDCYKTPSKAGGPGFMNIRGIMPIDRVTSPPEEPPEEDVPFYQENEEEEESEHKEQQSRKYSLEDKDMVIMRESAAKTASNIIAAFITAGKEVGGDELLMLAKQIEQYLLEG